jgi:hypothetical protein
MKSTLNGKKATASGTKSTPPPTPETGAINPIKKVNNNNIKGHNHTGGESIDFVTSPTSAAQQLLDIASTKTTATVMNNATCDFLKLNI